MLTASEPLSPDSPESESVFPIATTKSASSCGHLVPLQLGDTLANAPGGISLMSYNVTFAPKLAKIVQPLLALENVNFRIAPRALKTLNLSKPLPGGYWLPITTTPCQTPWHIRPQRR